MNRTVSCSGGCGKSVECKPGTLAEHLTAFWCGNCPPRVLTEVERASIYNAAAGFAYPFKFVSAESSYLPPGAGEQALDPNCPAFTSGSWADANGVRFLPTEVEDDPQPIIAPKRD